MGLVKRGKYWCMRFTYQGRQVRRSTGTGDRRLAEAILGKVRAQIVEGQWFEKEAADTEAATRTFAELMARYLAEHAAKKAQPRHYRGYAQNLSAFFGGRTLVEITPKLIVEYKNRRYAAGLKPASINRELATMKKAFNLAVKEWGVGARRILSRGCRWSGSTTSGTAGCAWKDEARLLQVCPPWLCDLVTFAIHTGMRMGEILALTWRGVDFNRRTVTVFRSKNGERRTIPINDTVLSVLRRKNKIRSVKTDVVFCSQAFTPLEAGHLRRAFRVAMKKSPYRGFPISTICGIRSPHGSFKKAWICTRSNGCWGTSRPP